ncbi:MAG: hypothetical protein LBQ60_03940 [Bacteroidales bacterium]|jgi:hypothetical protein|nr:hypothetical protein [Bacteroidales bacterium]
MKKVILIQLVLLVSVFTSFGQLRQWQPSDNEIQYIGGNVGIGFNNYFGSGINNPFTYQQNSIGHYSLGWFSDTDIPGTSTLWMSGHGGIKFFTRGEPRLVIAYLGNVGIGTTTPTAKLTVAGDILAREIRVEANAGADFVFEENYQLKPLKEVEQFITEKKHLPDIAPADTMIQNGVNMGEFQIQLLQKIEELTLYTIEQNKELEKQNERIKLLEKKLEQQNISTK